MTIIRPSLQNLDQVSGSANSIYVIWNPVRLFKFDNVLLLKYMYIFVIFESPVIAHDVYLGFLFYVLYVDFRLLDTDILSLCSVFYIGTCLIDSGVSRI